MFKNPLKNGLRLMRSNSRAIHRAYGASDSRMLHLAGISGVGNILLGLGKIASGILSLSVFVCINGLYTLGMVLARYCALAGAIRTQDAGQQYGYGEHEPGLPYRKGPKRYDRVPAEGRKDHSFKRSCPLCPEDRAEYASAHPSER